MHTTQAWFLQPRPCYLQYRYPTTQQYCDNSAVIFPGVTVMEWIRCIGRVARSEVQCPRWCAFSKGQAFCRPFGSQDKWQKVSSRWSCIPYGVPLGTSPIARWRTRTFQHHAFGFSQTIPGARVYFYLSPLVSPVMAS